MLQEHDWSGNVRELYNVMERAYIIAGGNRIQPEHLPPLTRRTMPTAQPTIRAMAMPSNDNIAPRTLEEVEMDHLLFVLEKHGGSKTAAAAELGISLKTIYNKLNALEKKRKLAG